MSNINEGSQDILWKFRFDVTGIHNHRALKDIILPGIFSGMELTVDNTTDITIGAGAVILNGKFNNVNEVCTKINFNLSNTKTIPQTTPLENEIVYLTYEYQEVIQNFADVLHDSISNFLATPPDNFVILGEIVYDNLGNIVSIDKSRRMERAVAHMNEFGLLTNNQANKFLYTNSIVDKDFTLPTIGNSNLAVIREMSVNSGVTLTIPNGELLLVLEETRMYSGKLLDVFLLKFETKVFTISNVKTVIAQLCGVGSNYSNIQLWTDGNSMYVKNNNSQSTIGSVN